MSLYLKDPQARVDHAIDWTAYLAGQSVVASLWFVTPGETGGVVVEDAALDEGRTSARMSGGLVGRVYRVTNRVTLSDGQVDERSMLLRVEDR